jgi:hypothetical protein
LTPDPQPDHASPAERGRASPIWLPVWLVLRPGRFFKAWGSTAPLGWLIAAAWIVGTGSMASSVINRLQTDLVPSFIPFSIDRWSVLWIVLIATGLLRGLGVYALGGAWFRARLWLSGERSRCWGRSVRVYLGGRLVEQAAALAMLILIMFLYNDLTDFIDHGWPMWILLPGGAALIWGGVVSFLGARAVFRLTAWAWLWMFAVPIAWRIALCVGMLWIAVAGLDGILGPLSPSASWREPGVRTHFGERVTVAVPVGWTVTERPDGADAQSPDGRRGWGIWIVPTPAVEALKDELLGTQDMQLNFEKSGSWGRWAGVLSDLDVPDPAGTNRVVILVCPLDTNHAAVFRTVCPVDEWGDAYRDLERCMASATVVDPRIVGVDPAKTRLVDMGDVTFEVPQTWRVEEDTHDSASNPGRPLQTWVRSPGMAEVDVIRYHSDRTPQAELETTIDSFRDRYKIDRVKPVTRWRDRACVGARCSARTLRGMPVEMEFVVIDLGDRGFLELAMIHASHEPTSLLEGVRIIERTLRISESSPEP